MSAAGSAPESAAVIPGQAARADLEAAVLLAVTENRDCRGSVPCGFCERRVAKALAAVDAYVAARQPQPAPGPVWRVVVSATGEPASDETGTREEAEREAGELNQAAGRGGWFGARPVPQVAPELAAVIRDIIDRYPEREPAPGCPDPSAHLVILDSAGGKVPPLGTAWRLLDEARDRLAALAGEFSAATADDHVDGYTPGSLYMAVRAEVLHECAARIREGLPS